MKMENKSLDSYYMSEAIKEAKRGLKEGGIPIGCVLVMNEKIIGRGHNRRVQKDSCILHAEMDCLENAGRLTLAQYSICTIYSTLSPCAMCTGAIVLYKIPRTVIGECDTFIGPLTWLTSQPYRTFTNMDLSKCKIMMKTFIKENLTLWNEDIGV